jgi:hypothetical protein
MAKDDEEGKRKKDKSQKVPLHWAKRNSNL